jgi:hypothetical protein
MANNSSQSNPYSPNLSGEIVEIVDSYTITNADNGKVLFVTRDIASYAMVYLNETNPPSNGFSCSIIALTEGVRVSWDNSMGGIGYLYGPAMTNGVWSINDTTNNGVGMGATLVVKDSTTLKAHIFGAVISV